MKYRNLSSVVHVVEVALINVLEGVVEVAFAMPSSAEADVGAIIKRVQAPSNHDDCPVQEE